MTIKECLESLSLIDKKYSNEEDKNYNLVHRMMELIGLINDDDLETLKGEILKIYSYNLYSSFRDYVCVMSKNNSVRSQKPFEQPVATKLKNEHTNIIDFYDSYDENLIRFIKGHLFLEFAMNTIIEKALNRSTRKTFSQKIDILFSESLISENEKELLSAINTQRNKVAHNLNYVLTFDTIFTLVRLSAKAGVDFSDNTIYKNKKLSEEWYGIDGIINEIFPNTFCHLFYQNEECFQDQEFLKYMC